MLSPASLPEVVLEHVTWSNKNLDTHYDLGNGMNMISQLPVFPMAYPIFYFDLAKQIHANAIIVADSYYWGMHNIEVTKHFFKESEFWFYN